MRDNRNVYRNFIGKPEERGHMENPVVDGKIILIWIWK
jgi:hypothetical protein